jgi:formamidopyrimidine-DNA glycosylase
MIEIPEAINLSHQLNECIGGKKIVHTEAGHSPHKFTWYHEDPAGYGELLNGKIIGGAKALGGMIEIEIEDAILLLSEGLKLRVGQSDDAVPVKHQLLLKLENGGILFGSVQMYAGICAFRRGAYDNEYYRAAKEKPNPLSDQFTEQYFQSILTAPGAEKLSAKALCATEQRIPGLGNGVLQDILLNAQIHPKKKVSTFSDKQADSLFRSIKNTLEEMVEHGGRDTEFDLLGNPGGYATKLSRKTVGSPCAMCGTDISKLSYMGGSVYICSSCQEV